MPAVVSENLIRLNDSSGLQIYNNSMYDTQSLLIKPNGVAVDK